MNNRELERGTYRAIPLEQAVEGEQHPFFASWTEPVFDGPDPKPKHVPHNLDLNTENAGE